MDKHQTPPTAMGEKEQTVKEQHIDISNESDIEKAGMQAKKLLQAIGFNETGQAMVLTSVFELARNLYRYAEEGSICIKIIGNSNREGIEISSQDKGPGIEDIDKAMQDSFSTTPHSLGVGLGAVKRMMDELKIDSEMGKGTLISAKKWL